MFPKLNRVSFLLKNVENASKYFLSSSHSKNVGSSRFKSLNSQTLREPSKSKYKLLECEPNDLTEDEQIATLKTVFECTKDKAFELHAALKLPKSDLCDVVSKVKWLRRRNIQLTSIMDNCDLLLKPKDEIEENFALLKSMNWRKSDDFLPLLNIKYENIINTQSLEVNRMRRRVYELAEHFAAEPYDVSKSCAKVSFVFKYENDLLWQKIDLLMTYNVLPENILKDLQVLGPSMETLTAQLNYLVANDIERILPWMLRFGEREIQKMIELRRKLSTSQKQIVDLLGSKLKLNGATARKICKKKFTLTIDPDEMSLVIDFLLETYTPNEILKNVYLLNTPLIKLSLRLMEAKAAGIAKPNPEYLTKSQKAFSSYLLSEKTESKNKTKIAP